MRLKEDGKLLRKRAGNYIAAECKTFPRPGNCKDVMNSSFFPESELLTIFARKLQRTQGHRLGEAQEVTPLSAGPSAAIEAKYEIPPVHNSELTDEEREQKRRERVAAAEARLKKAGGPPKKKKEYKDVPLTGPNSKPTMTWTAG